MYAVLLVMSVMQANLPATARLSDRYATGQVWEYHARPEDAGSLIKIQAVEFEPAFRKQGPVYHISVIGLHLKDPALAPLIGHVPVTQATLDASVTRLHGGSAPFPDASAGIAEWHRARGGVYSESVADIVEQIDRSAASQATDAPQKPLPASSPAMPM